MHPSRTERWPLTNLRRSTLGLAVAAACLTSGLLAQDKPPEATAASKTASAAKTAQATKASPPASTNKPSASAAQTSLFRGFGRGAEISSELGASLEEMLQQGLENSPEIKIAEAKLKQAQAELDAARLAVTSKIIESRTELLDLKQKLQVEREQAAILKNLVEKNAAPESQLINARQAADAIDNRLQERQTVLQYLLGTKTSRLLPLYLSANRATAGDTPMQPEISKAMEKVHAALEKPVELEFNETPIRDVVDFLIEYVGINIVLVVADPAERDWPTTINIKGVPLGAAIQAIEDTHEVRFFVRDYGMMVVVGNRAIPGATPAVEWWRKLAPARAATIKR